MQTMKILALKKYSLFVILQVARESVMKWVKAARFASLIIDGATDASIMEQDIVYVRTCQAGVIDVDFIGLETTPKSGKTNLYLSIYIAVHCCP